MSTTPTPTGSTSPTPSGPASPEQDWPAEIADRIEAAVATVRSKTTVPAILAAEGVVYGVMLAVLGATMFILFVIALVRVLDVYLPIHPAGRRVYVTYAIASAILLLSGMFLWRKRRPSSV